MGLDTLVEWSPDPDSCLDQFTMVAHVCGGVRSQNGWLLGASEEGSQKLSRTLARGV